jgi:DNA-binding XRE family transcriptional regulator
MNNTPTTRKRESEPEPAVGVDFARAKRVRRARKGSERVSLRTAREAMGMTQAEMASALGTDQGEVSRIERRPHVRFSTLCKYAKALGARCDVAFVFADGRHLLVEVKADEPPR